jgi:hypothetical protein
MKRIARCALLIAALLLSANRSFGASAGYVDDPLKISIGARAMAMGGVFAALDDGPNQITNNPAGIAGRPLMLSSMAASLLGDVNYVVVGANWPVNWTGAPGGFGLGFAGSSVGSFINPDPTGFTYFDYHNDAWVACYGQEIPGRNAKFGLRLKCFREGFSGSQSAEAKGLDLDTGLIIYPWEKTRLGFVLYNLLPNDLGARVVWTNGDYESVPLVFRAGVASTAWREDTLLALDLESNPGRGNYPARLHGGAEWKPVQSLALRGGLDQSYDAGSVSTNLTLGVGLVFNAFIFDYAYHPYFSSGDNTTHYFSLALLIDKLRPKLAPPPVTREAAVALPAPAAVPAVSAEAGIKERKARPVGPVKKVYHYPSRGDTLTRLSLRYYGTAEYAARLGALNNLKAVNRRLSGKVVVVPPLNELP